MAYYESAEGIEISKERAICEIEKHGCDIDQFLHEVGEKEEYEAQEVLAWLGY